MADRGQVVRFAVGAPDGPRSRTWRLWVPTGKSDVYVSGRRLGNSVKVSLHEPGPARFTLTQEFVEKSGFQALRGRTPDSQLNGIDLAPNLPRGSPARSRSSCRGMK